MPNLSIFTLYENNLNVTIPPYVCNMQQLVVLSLRSNQFFGELPHIVGSKLGFLDVGLNNLSGNVPTSLGVLSSLQILKLNNNNFSGEIPNSLQNYSSLMSIDLGDDKLSSNIPLWIGGSNVSMLSRHPELMVAGVKKYRDMRYIEAMTKGSEQRYLGDIAKLKIGRGVVGAVADNETMVRTGASQVEGGVHGLVSYEKKSFCLLYLFSFSHPAGDCGLRESSVFHYATNILPI
ncbi:hypothetical protein DVH24_010936 [Malus domestica]|uniref:Uncharacterized protein n=1 Tax=Malus domestica TaxID=3750 RepID=A0A498JZK2_MALDO|nr:hypothetical protein DVH24_010936 [Malus domestica]